MEWREALRQKLEAFLDYRDPAKMMPLLHDMYRDFHTRLQEEFGAPGTASSFELAEADAKTAFTLGGTGGIRSNVNTIAANGQKNGMQDSVRRSRADWLRRLEQGGEQEQDFKHHPSENIIQVSQTPTEALVKSKPSSQEQRTNRGSVDGSTHRDSGCGALLDGARRPTESLEAGRPMSVRTRRDLLAGARQSVDSALEMERDRASFASFSVTDSFANRPFTGSSSIDASASNVASHGRPDSASHPPGKTGQELLLKSLYAQSGGGSVNWRGQLGPVSQSLAADPRSPDGAESRPMTGNGRRPPKNPSLPATGSDHEGLDETPSPKVCTVSRSVFVFLNISGFLPTLCNSRWICSALVSFVVLKHRPLERLRCCRRKREERRPSLDSNRIDRGSTDVKCPLQIARIIRSIKHVQTWFGVLN